MSFGSNLSSIKIPASGGSTHFGASYWTIYLSSLVYFLYLLDIKLVNHHQKISIQIKNIRDGVFILLLK
jgi:hypothetical protein